LRQAVPVFGVDRQPRTDLPFPIEALDIRDPALADHLRAHAITHVVHLAAVLESSGDRARDFDIDVNGTRAVLQACVAAGVQHVTVTSSGAAYGYHADNPEWLRETDPLRGNPEFAYADHKRQVEALLESWRTEAPQLGQLIFRVSTVLGRTTRNQITALFHRPRLLAVRGSASPFVFIWDEDVVAAIVHGVTHDRTGIFNLTGSGAIPMRSIAHHLGKPLLTLPGALLASALAIGKVLGVTRYGPEQLRFLRYRPVLANEALLRDFGWRPTKSSLEALQYFAEAQGLGWRP
jgi:UDP-glucose 4-epimerase